MQIGKTEVTTSQAHEVVTLTQKPAHYCGHGLWVSTHMDPDAAAGLALALMNELRSVAGWEGYRKGMIDALESWGEPRTIESDIAEGRI